MSLIAARGPLGPKRLGWFSAPIPEDVVYVELHHPRRVQAVLGDEKVIDTEHAPKRALICCTAPIRQPIAITNVSRRAGPRLSATPLLKTSHGVTKINAELPDSPGAPDDCGCSA
jgi:hypothetical protein